VDGRQRGSCGSCGYVDWPAHSLAVGVAIVQDGRLLLGRRVQEPAGGLWTFPGGFAEVDEQPESTAVREVEEETGLLVEVLDLLAVRAVPEPLGLNLYFVFSARPIGGLAAPDETEFDALQWFDVVDLERDHDVAQLSLEVGRRALGESVGLKRAHYRRRDGVSATLYAAAS
jgi:ADP-ribose pyrophosphatase YjhB (NUDIX family)